MAQHEREAFGDLGPQSGPVLLALLVLLLCWLCWLSWLPWLRWFRGGGSSGVRMASRDATDTA